MSGTDCQIASKNVSASWVPSHFLSPRAVQVLCWPSVSWLWCVFVRAGQGRIVYCGVWLGGLRKLMGTKGHSRSHPAARDIMEIQDWMECDGRQGAWSSSCECLRVFVPLYRRSPKTRHPCAFRIQSIITAMLANGATLGMAWIRYPACQLLAN